MVSSWILWNYLYTLYKYCMYSVIEIYKYEIDWMRKGGMKAVIWTDVTQTIMMFLGVILSIVFGMMSLFSFWDFFYCSTGFNDAGGVKNVFKSVMDGNRIQLSTYVVQKAKRFSVFFFLEKSLELHLIHRFDILFGVLLLAVV